MWRRRWEGRGVYHLIFLLPILPLLPLLLLPLLLQAKAQARLLDPGDRLRRHVQRGAGVGRHPLQAPEQQEEEGWVNRDSHGRVGTMSVNVNVNVR